jgi:MFS family permease
VALPLRAAPRRSRLRRSLSSSYAEGAAAEVVGACCGGAVLTGWAVHLGMSPGLVGFVSALPLVAQVLQIPGALLTARFGSRHTALVSVALSRQAFFPLVFLPALPLGADGQRTLLLVVAGAHHGLGVVTNNAWTAWMGEMVPTPLRGRYFGRRSAFCGAAGGVCALAAGMGLDWGDVRALGGAVLQALALLACASGALSVWLMARQQSRPARPEPIRWALRALARPLADARARRVAAYTVAWNGAIGLSAPFYGLYLLKDLETGYTLLAAQGAGLALVKVVSVTAWGRAVDRSGARRVLILCTGGLALSPLAWIACAPGRLWPLAVETALGGLLFAGHGVASFALPLSIGPERERPFYLAAVGMAGGIAFAVTSSLGVVLAEAHAPLRLVLAGSAALRVAAALAAVALPFRGRATGPIRLGPDPSPPELGAVALPSVAPSCSAGCAHS